jgi:hypothetical protein
LFSIAAQVYASGNLADMPNPNQQTDDELLERAKRLAAQISDPNVAAIVSALLIAEAIRFGSGRLT